MFLSFFLFFSIILLSQSLFSAWRNKNASLERTNPGITIEGAIAQIG